MAGRRRRRGSRQQRSRNPRVPIELRGTLDIGDVSEDIEERESGRGGPVYDLEAEEFVNPRGERRRRRSRRHRSRNPPYRASFSSPDERTAVRRALKAAGLSSIRLRGGKKRAPGPYALFVKEKMPELMASGMTAPEAMKQIGPLWRAQKAAKANPRRRNAAETYTVEGVLEAVYPTPGKLVISGRSFRLIDPRYWAAGSSARAHKALTSLQKHVGQRVMAEVTDHQTFGPTIFGRRGVKLSPRIRRRRNWRRRR